LKARHCKRPLFPNAIVKPLQIQQNERQQTARSGSLNVVIPSDIHDTHLRAAELDSLVDLFLLRCFISRL